MGEGEGVKVLVGEEKGRGKRRKEKNGGWKIRRKDGV